MKTTILIKSDTETYNDFIDRVEDKEKQVKHLFTTMSKYRAEINHEGMKNFLKSLGKLLAIIATVLVGATISLYIIFCL